MSLIKSINFDVDKYPEFQTSEARNDEFRWFNIDDLLDKVYRLYSQWMEFESERALGASTFCWKPGGNESITANTRGFLFIERERVPKNDCKTVPEMGKNYIEFVENNFQVVAGKGERKKRANFVRPSCWVFRFHRYNTTFRYFEKVSHQHQQQHSANESKRLDWMNE